MKRMCSLAALVLALPLIATAQEQYGVAYFYRGRDTPDLPKEISVLNPEAVVYLDSREFLSMPERAFIGFKIPAGRYVLSMRRKGARRVLNVLANKTHYLRVEQVAYPYARQIIYDVVERSALEALRKCDVLGERKIKLKQFEVLRVKPRPDKN